MDQRSDLLGFLEPSVDDYFRILGGQQNILHSRGGGIDDIIIYTPAKRGGSFFQFPRKDCLTVPQTAFIIIWVSSYEGYVRRG